jgi:hypothetical protein
MVKSEEKTIKKVRKYIQPSQKSASEGLVATSLIIIIFVTIFIFITGHSHFQLDLMNENSKQFVKNKIGAFEVN